MKILFIGVVVGSCGRDAVSDFLKKISAGNKKPDLVICNANHAAGGAGLTKETASELFGAGVDIITMGENVWDQKELQTFIEETTDILRPNNLPESNPGSGTIIKEVGDGRIKVGVINLSGHSFIKRIIPDNPFPGIYKLVDGLRNDTDIIILDFFTRTTAEKVAMRIHLDGRVSMAIGTGTLVQTADEATSKLGTASITDVGMCGASNSILGFDKEKEIKRFRTSMKMFPTPAEGTALVNAVLCEVDDKSGRALSIERIKEVIDN
jgi:metallophosphoesterase (TIGR00282 family)